MDWGYSLESILEIFRIMSIDIGGSHRIGFFYTSLFIEHSKYAFAVGVDSVMISGFGHRRSGFATTDIDDPPYSWRLNSTRGKAGHSDRSIIVLLPGV